MRKIWYQDTFFWQEEGDEEVRPFAMDATEFLGHRVGGVGREWMGGGIRLNKSNRVQIRKVISREPCADGISAQTCNDVSIEECYCHDNVGFGSHSGTGSQRPIARNNGLENNYIGYCFC